MSVLQQADDGSARLANTKTYCFINRLPIKRETNAVVGISEGCQRRLAASPPVRGARVNRATK